MNDAGNDRIEERRNGERVVPAQRRICSITKRSGAQLSTQCLRSYPQSQMCAMWKTGRGDVDNLEAGVTAGTAVPICWR
jgi:Holliday junction resolvase RusA-like endonuclease